MNNILITGKSGYIGMYLSSFLTNKGKLNIGVSRTPDSEDIGYQELPNKLNSSKAIVHLAGIAHDLSNKYEEKDYFVSNTELTKSIYEQFLNSDCNVFIYVSSILAVTENSSVPIDESFHPNPMTLFGKSKLSAENCILEKGYIPHKRVYILRPCIIYGPKSKGNLNLLYKIVSKSLPYPFGRFLNKRSFLAIDNFSYVIEKLIDNPQIPSGIYHISDDEVLSSIDLVKLISKVTNKPIKILLLPKKLVLLLGKIGDIFHLPINTKNIIKLNQDLVLSNVKIKSALKIIKMPVSTEVGIKLTFMNSSNKL